MPTKEQWLVPWDATSGTPAAVDAGKVEEAVWLPNPAVAKAWKEYVATGETEDETPPPDPTNVKISEDGVITWSATADLESGIGAFIIRRNGTEVARIPSKPIGRFGRPIFQAMSYHDTPEEPLPAMRYVVGKDATGEESTYSVQVVNANGLKSATVDAE
jgi:hypothetical protein